MGWRVWGLITAASAALLVPSAPVAADDAPIVVDLAMNVRAPAPVVVGKPAAFVASITYKSGTEPIDNIGLWMDVPGPGSPGVRLKTTPLQHLTFSMPRSCSLHWRHTPQPGRRGVRLLICDMSGLSPGKTKSVSIKITSRVPGRIVVWTTIWSGRERTDPGEIWIPNKNLEHVRTTIIVKAPAKRS